MKNGFSDSQPKLNPAQAKRLVETAQRVAGVLVAQEKTSFLELRVGRRLRELDMTSYEDYVEYLLGPGGEQEAQHLAEALTTHTTSFFRERAHYDWLKTTGLPALVDEGAGREYKLTIWSAACSLGSEMWTAAMVIDRFAADRSGELSWEVVGTDVSARILRRAANAVFTEDEISGLSEELRRSYLMQYRGERKLYRIVPELRNRARLSRANLVRLDSKLDVRADVVFLRNVLIYFTPEDQKKAVDNVLGRLRLGGYLLTGHSESLAEVPPSLRQVAASTYQKVGRK